MVPTRPVLGAQAKYCSQTVRAAAIGRAVENGAPTVEDEIADWRCPIRAVEVVEHTVSSLRIYVKHRPLVVGAATVGCAVQIPVRITG